MKTQDNSYWIEVYPEDNSDYDKTTIGGVRIEIEDDCDEKTIIHLTRKEATKLAKLIREAK